MPVTENTSDLNNGVLISICIPAFKRVDFLKRLLDSITIQTFRNFEVIVTDDSPSAEVEELCSQYASQFTVHVYKNTPSLGTPENWNEAIRRASGQWIKLTHDDDWFSSKNSLQKFADAINANPGCSFFFSAYTNVYEGTGRQQPMFLKPFWKKALLQDPNILIADNVIGPPSVTLHRNNQSIWYDKNMKYVVDIDFYIRYLQKAKFFFIGESLVNVGINSAQVTKYTFAVPEVHLKESLYLLQKTGAQHLKHILVFDGWWRLLRNFNMRSVKDIRSTGYDGNIPSILLRMMKFQQKVPRVVLKNGAFSKLLMGVCYSLQAAKIQD